MSTGRRESKEDAAAGDDDHPALKAIVVQDLHGKFSYDLVVSPPQAAEEHGELGLASVTSQRLTLLYGTNGTGKTSLLRLLFHALSPAGDRGHRRALREMRFREFKVTMTDASYVRYHRTGPDDHGGFSAEIRLGSRGEPLKAQFWLEDEMAASGEKAEREFVIKGVRQGVNLATNPVKYAHIVSAGRGDTALFSEALAELGVNPVFLEDSRVITGDALDLPAPPAALARARAARERRADADEEIRRRRDIDVEEALYRVRIYLSQLAFAGTQAGSARVDNVYQNVAAAVIQSSSKPGRPNKTLLPALRDRVATLEARAERYHAYGLIPESPMPALSKVLDSAEFKHGPVLTQVLTPHLDGFSERLARILQ